MGLSFVLLVFSPRLTGPFHLGCCLLGQGFSVPGGLQQDPMLQKHPVPSSAGREPGAEGLSLTHRGAAWSPAPSRALPSLIKTLTRRHT